MTFSTSQAETKTLLYILDGIALLPCLALTCQFSSSLTIEGLSWIYNDDGSAIAACIIATIGFLIRPLIVSELHMTYYRKQLSEAGKHNFVAMTVFLPVFVSIMTLGLTSYSGHIEIPITTCL